MFANHTPTGLTGSDAVYSIPQFSEMAASEYPPVMWINGIWLPKTLLMDAECTPVHQQLSNYLFHPPGSTPAQIVDYMATIPPMPPRHPAYNDTMPNTAAFMSAHASVTASTNIDRAEVTMLHSIVSRVKTALINSLDEATASYVFPTNAERINATPNSIRQSVLEKFGTPQHDDYAALEQLAKRPITAGTRAALTDLVAHHQSLHFIHAAINAALPDRNKVSLLLDSIKTSAFAATFTTAITLYNNNYPAVATQTFNQLVIALKATDFPPTPTLDATAASFSYANAAPRNRNARNVGMGDAAPGHTPIKAANNREPSDEATARRNRCCHPHHNLGNHDSVKCFDPDTKPILDALNKATTNKKNTYRR